MIRSAKEAKEIIENCGAHEDDHTLCNNAKGYLIALKGPEVKALVEALNLMHEESEGECTEKCVTMAVLRKYHEAVKL